MTQPIAATPTGASGTTVDTGTEPRRLDKLLDQVAGFVRRFVVLSAEQADAVALWIVHTHTFDAAEISPYLAVVSAEKRSGKTTLLKVVERLCRRPWRVITPSEAVLFRKIDRDHPTVLLDEIDTIFGRGRENEPLRALLNAGNERGTVVPRCGGPNRDRLDEFEIFSPKSFAGIGIERLPGTIRDRSIVIEMSRKAPDEHVDRFRRRRVSGEAEPLRQALVEWAEAALDLLRDAEPELPEQLSDRAADIWEPLLAIADLAGGAWPDRARRAAVSLSAGEEAADDSLGVRLLADIRTIFDEVGAEKLASADLANALAQIEDAPWGDWKGKPLSPPALAKLLKRYRIRPKGLRIGESTPRGYERGMFEDAFKRYLTAAECNSRNKQAASGSESPPRTATVNHALHPFGGHASGRQADVAAVAARAPGDRHTRAGRIARAWPGAWVVGRQQALRREAA